MSHDSEQNQRSALQHEAEHASPGKKNSVLIYLVILFAAAFLLLLLSYFMQQRASREAYNSLQQSSNSAVQSLDNMLQENEDLKEQVAQLEQELAEAQEQSTQLQVQLNASEDVVKALDSLNHLRALYNQREMDACRSYLASIDQAQVEAALQSFVDQNNDAAWLEVYNPLQAWLDLKEWLN